MVSKWTPENEKMCERMWRTGMTVRQLAAGMDMCESSIAKFLRRKGLKTKRVWVQMPTPPKRIRKINIFEELYAGRRKEKLVEILKQDVDCKLDIKQILDQLPPETRCTQKALKELLREMKIIKVRADYSDQHDSSIASKDQRVRGYKWQIPDQKK